MAHPPSTFALLAMVVMVTAMKAETNNEHKDIVPVPDAPPLLINKCCKYNEHLDTWRKKCVKDNEYNEGAAEEEEGSEESVGALVARGQLALKWLSGVNLTFFKAPENAVVRYGRWPCEPDLTAAVWSNKGRLFPNGSLEVREVLRFSGEPDTSGRLLFSQAEFCADRIYYEGKGFYDVYLTCPCSRLPCIRKCCDDGYKLLYKQERAQKKPVTCEKATNVTLMNRKWNVTLEEDSGNLNSSKTPYARLKGPLPVQCGSGHTVVSVDFSDKSYGLKFLSNGNLAVNISGWGSPFLPQEYCVDLGTTDDGVESFWASVCAKNAPAKQVTPFDVMYVLRFLVGILALIGTLVVYWLVPSLRRPVNAKAFLCHVGSILMSHVILCASRLIPQVDTFGSCAFLAFSVQFFMLAAFCWLSVQCFDIARGLSSVFRVLGNGWRGGWRRFFCYSLFAWGVPGSIVAVSIAFTYAPKLPSWVLRPGIGKRYCWFYKGLPQLAYYNGPVAVLLSANLVMFVFTIWRIRKSQYEMDQLAGGRYNGENSRSGGTLSTRKERLVLILKLFLVMGVMWVAEVVAWALHADNTTLFIIEIIQTLRCVGVFVAFCCKPKVLNTLMTKWTCCRGGMKPEWNRRRSQDSSNNRTTTSILASESITNNIPIRSLSN